MNKVQFIEKAVSIDPNLRFQYWYKNHPSKTWYKYEEIKSKYPNLFQVNQQMLRTGIETKEISECRIDIDAKDNGGKSLSKSISVGKYISNVLRINKIKHSIYYTGGSGVHIQFLYNSKPFQQFENQKQVREEITQHLGFLDLIDRQVLGNNQVLTCEGYSKRKSEDNSLKIYLSRSTLNYHIEGGKKSWKEFIEENKFKEIINENYFNEINEFSDEIIKHVEKRLEVKKTLPTNQLQEEKNNCLTKTSQEIKPRNIILASDKVINQHLITFSKIYREKGIRSTNNFYTIVCTYLFSSTMNIDKTLDYFNKFFDVFNCPDNLSCSREQKVSLIISNFNDGKTKIFFKNEYLTKEEFYNEYYRIFPKKEFNSVAYAGNNNEQKNNTEIF